MPRTPTQARAARKLRRENPWIATNPDAAALAQQLVYLAQGMDVEYGGSMAETARAYLDTRAALLALQPEA